MQILEYIQIFNSEYFQFLKIIEYSIKKICDYKLFTIFDSDNFIFGYTLLVLSCSCLILLLVLAWPSWSYLICLGILFVLPWTCIALVLLCLGLV